MNKKRIELSSLIEFLGNSVLNVYGTIDGCFIDHLADAAHVDETTLDWVGATNPHKQQVAESSKAKVILVDAEVNYSDIIKTSSKTLIVVDNPKRCLALIGDHFFVVRPLAGIHPTAIVDPEAKIGYNVSIGMYAVIGKAEIGDNCIVCPFVRIYDNVTIGHDTHIKDGAIIGGEGYGYERDENGNRFRFPQIGDVKIGNHVDIGSHTCIDRGALSTTIIGDYAKIDNLCHIGHNDNIGKNVAIVACTEISGSVRIGDNSWVGPNSAIRDQCKIGEGTMIGLGSSVIMDIGSNEVWSGYPARRINEKK